MPEITDEKLLPTLGIYALPTHRYQLFGMEKYSFLVKGQSMQPSCTVHVRDNQFPIRASDTSTLHRVFFHQTLPTGLRCVGQCHSRNCSVEDVCDHKFAWRKLRYKSLDYRQSRCILVSRWDRPLDCRFQLDTLDRSKSCLPCSVIVEML